MSKIELIALSLGVDHILYDNDIDPVVVLEWLLENDMIDLSIYDTEEIEDG